MSLGGKFGSLQFQPTSAPALRTIRAPDRSIQLHPSQSRSNKPIMPISAAPRSVSDATRFTAATPHASSKAAAPRFAAPRSGRGAAPGGGGGGSGGNAGPGIVETPEQRVARLRAAHRRAKEAQVSRFDKVVDAGRRVFDSAHKITVYGIVLFTGECRTLYICSLTLSCHIFQKAGTHKH